ncbi:MAG: phosphoenolpyruvate--protein phosphotransferase, partial [Verrucomicrobia bacterium 21-51-4]
MYEAASVNVFVVTQKSPEIVLKGIAASPGVAYGHAWLVRHADLEVLRRKVAIEDSAAELDRFEQALVATRTEIVGLKNQVAKHLGEPEAQIFEAHLLVLEDRALIDESIRRHQETLDAIDYCFKTVAQEYLDAFSKINDEYIRERAADIRDVTRRVLQKLTGAVTYPIEEAFGPAVLVSDLLTPSDTTQFGQQSIAALVTSAATRTSHALIMARTLGIPAVVGVRRCVQLIPNSVEVIVDGHRGLVFLNPSEQTQARYTKTLQALKAKATPVSPRHQLADGAAYTLLANIDGPEGIVRSKMAGAQGVGLFRSEMVFLKERGFPSETQQFEVYKHMVQAMSDEPLVIRTLDLGGDKPLLHAGYFENNPLMGLRGIRFCLAHPVIFKQQLRAILRASLFGDIRIMFPFVSTVSELEQALAILQECKDQLLLEGVKLKAHVPVGVMIEVPSAAIRVADFCKRCDFIS